MKEKISLATARRVALAAQGPVGLAGVERAADRDGLAVDGDVAAIGEDGAGEDFDESAFAGAIFADQGEGLAGVEG